MTRQTLQAPSVERFYLPLAAVLAETPERAVELLGLVHQRRARHDLDPAVDTLLADLASG